MRPTTPTLPERLDERMVGYWRHQSRVGGTVGVLGGTAGPGDGALVQITAERRWIEFEGGEEIGRNKLRCGDRGELELYSINPMWVSKARFSLEGSELRICFSILDNSDSFPDGLEPSSNAVLNTFEAIEAPAGLVYRDHAQRKRRRSMRVSEQSNA